MGNVNEEINEEVVYWLLFIKNRMKEMKLDANDVFMNGNCGNLYSIFQKIFKEKAVPHSIKYKGEPWHIVTEIEGKLYDISGLTNIEKYCKYLNEHNEDDEYRIEDFSECVTDLYTVEKQSNQYDYDSRHYYENKMFQLEQYIDKQIKQIAEKNTKTKLSDD